MASPLDSFFETIHMSNILRQRKDITSYVQVNAPFMIGKVTLWTGSGTPSAIITAVAAGDLYIDYTGGNLWIAGAAGTGNWTEFSPSAASLSTGTTIGGTAFNTGSGTPKSVVTPGRIGDIYFDYANGFIWSATGLTNTSWQLAEGNGAVRQTYFGTVTLAQLNAGKVLVAGITGYTLTPIYYKIVVNGTAAGSGNVILEDTNSSPVVITTVTEAGLAGILTSEAAASGKTDGVGLYGGLTSGKGIQIPASSSITTLTSLTVVIDYLIT